MQGVPAHVHCACQTVACTLHPRRQNDAQNPGNHGQVINKQDDLRRELGSIMASAPSSVEFEFWASARLSVVGTAEVSVWSSSLNERRNDVELGLDVAWQKQGSD
jgi:hypothetical protein